MNTGYFSTLYNDFLLGVSSAISSEATYVQIALVVIIYLVAYLSASNLRKVFKFTKAEPDNGAHPISKLLYRVGGILYPLAAIILLKISAEVCDLLSYPAWLTKTALVIAGLLFFYSFVSSFVTNKAVGRILILFGLPLLLLRMLGHLQILIDALEEISLSAGNVTISAYGLLRILIFGGLLFWLGRESNRWGKDVIRRQHSLDVRTREVFSKLYEVGLFCVICVLLLNLMGINLTTLAVFGGAVGVGLGLGLQSIASNFISGIIILLDRSLTVNDFVELDDGTKGFVREFCMRYAVLETYDGKDILVPNEKFISSQLVNWTHKDNKQRYRVDFSVPYATDIRSMVEYIKVAVAEHPQVMAGPEIPFEERPDCEIDSFGDSGVNMFVEFWMEGIDDGKNRVGGDLMLIIFETLRANGIEIPFPQREVRILNQESGQSL